MKLLVLTQKVDMNDPVLGFFHRWLLEFSKNYESVIVVCLGSGKMKLPDNVRVFSLGKRAMFESGLTRRIGYLFNFYKNILRELRNYDSVFVHMNQEYVVLGFPIWKIFGKRIMLWRNHPAGNFLTDFAVFISDVVFCTSKFSYTARFKKTRIMPVGIDTDSFRKNEISPKYPNSILYLGRISRIKNIDLLIEALNGIKKIEKKDFRLDVVGDAYSTDDQRYLNELKEMVSKYALKENISFPGPVSNNDSVGYYNSHEVTVNLSPDGMFDKVIFEAMSCEGIVLTSNKNLSGEIGSEFLFEFGDKNDLQEKLIQILKLSPVEKKTFGKNLRNYVVARHGLERLMNEVRKYS